MQKSPATLNRNANAFLRKEQKGIILAGIPFKNPLNACKGNNKSVRNSS